jgi:hypothetical protein
VLSAPHATEHVELAEAALQEFVTARFGEVFQTLQEHIDHGLPRAEETAAVLGSDGWEVASFGSGYLPRWLLGMIFHHELLATGLPELPELHAFYNQTVAPHDNREPAYRRVFAASCRRSREELETAVDACRSGDEPAEVSATLAAIGGAVLARRLTPHGAEISASKAEAAQAHQLADDLQRVVVDRDAHIVGLREQVASLEARLDRQSLRLRGRMLRESVQRTIRGKLG